MFGADKGTANKLKGKKLVIGIVQARFNEPVTGALWAACKEELLHLGVLEKHIQHVTVPGALEVGLALQAKTMMIASDARAFLPVLMRVMFTSFTASGGDVGSLGNTTMTTVALSHKPAVLQARYVKLSGPL